MAKQNQGHYGKIKKSRSKDPFCYEDFKLFHSKLRLAKVELNSFQNKKKKI